jgi:hypothetical protein
MSGMEMLLNDRKHARLSALQDRSTLVLLAVLGILLGWVYRSWSVAYPAIHLFLVFSIGSRGAFAAYRRMFLPPLAAAKREDHLAGGDGANGNNSKDIFKAIEQGNLHWAVGAVSKSITVFSSLSAMIGEFAFFSAVLIIANNL